MTNRDQVLELNTYVKTTLKPSPIHGVGVFALRDIPKGSKLYTDMIPRIYTLPKSQFCHLFAEISEHLLSQWPQIEEGSHFAYPTTKMQAWMNHSDDANYDAVLDLVLTDIKAGDEITEDYRKIPGAMKVFPFLAVL